jgi:hypothetical protein
LPAYHDVGTYHTLALPVRTTKIRRRELPADLDVRAATSPDLPEVIRFLESNGSRRQFFPRYSLNDFLGDAPTFRGMDPGKLMLARRHGQLVGTLGLWDQHAFRQTEIESYRFGLRWTRSVLNCVARLRGLPALPPTGAALRYGLCAVPTVRNDDPNVLLAMIEAQQRATADGPCQFLLIGVHERDPLRASLSRLSFAQYVTRMYVVCFDDEWDPQSLDDRCPYLELGCL